jgi:Flp pilus assembly pilin Flp
MKSCTRRQKGQQGQMTLEYAVMVAVILGVVIWAGVNVIRPSMGRFFTDAGDVMNTSAQAVQSRFQ